jgi:hypothetical protein
MPLYKTLSESPWGELKACISVVFFVVVAAKIFFVVTQQCFNGQFVVFIFVFKNCDTNSTSKQKWKLQIAPNHS